MLPRRFNKTIEISGYCFCVLITDYQDGECFASYGTYDVTEVCEKDEATATEKIIEIISKLEGI
jgi:hypothetical protein